MSTWSENIVVTNGIKIHYYRTGGDKPPVVINHGAGDDGLCWTHLARELDRDYDLILPDARGHGKSDSGKGDYSTAARVADLLGLIHTLKLERPVVGGHSMGADTSMHLAADYGQWVRGIFLEDPPIILPGEIFGDGKQTFKAEEIGKMMAKFMRIFKRLPRFVGVRLARKNSPTYPDDEIMPWIDSKRRLSRDFLNSMPSLKLDMSAPFEVVQRITVPVLLFIGDREKMSIVSQEAARQLVSANDKVQLVHLAGASHDIRRTRFDGYLPALQQFLAALHQL